MATKRNRGLVPRAQQPVRYELARVPIPRGNLNAPEKVAVGLIGSGVVLLAVGAIWRAMTG